MTTRRIGTPDRPGRASRQPVYLAAREADKVVGACSVLRPAPMA